MKVVGEGTVERMTDRDGKVTGYRIRHNLGRDKRASESKKKARYRYSSWRSGYKTRREARQALEEYRVELEGGFAPTGN
jgi:hypothetical protein